jgi:hypothetical protein
MKFIDGDLDATGASEAVSLEVAPGDLSVFVGLSGTFAGCSAKLEGKGPDGQWYPVACVDAGTRAVNQGGSAIALSDDTAKALLADVGAFSHVRAYLSARTSGTVACRIQSDSFGNTPVLGSQLAAAASASLGVPAVVSGTHANALAVGADGATNAALNVDTSSKTVTWGDAVNHAFNTTTGSKLGTAANQKLGFWNATPVVQPSGTGELLGFTGNAATNANAVNFAANGNNGSKSYSLGDIVKALKNAGILAAS